jgi:hypothetical protein
VNDDDSSWFKFVINKALRDGRVSKNISIDLCRLTISRRGGSGDCTRQTGPREAAGFRAIILCTHQAAVDVLIKTGNDGLQPSTLTR